MSYRKGAVNINTNYTFTISASDLAGNNYASNPIVLNATTTGVIGCSGTSSAAQTGTFSVGYNYAFETLGTDSGAENKPLTLVKKKSNIIPPITFYDTTIPRNFRGK